MSHSKMLARPYEFDTPVVPYKNFDEMKAKMDSLVDYASHAPGNQISPEKRKRLDDMIDPSVDLTPELMRLYYTGLFKGRQDAVGVAMNYALTRNKKIQTAIRLKEKLEDRRQKKK